MLNILWQFWRQGRDKRPDLCFKRITLLSGWKIDWKVTGGKQGCQSGSYCGAPGGRMKPFYFPVTEAPSTKQIRYPSSRKYFQGFCLFWTLKASVQQRAGGYERSLKCVLPTRPQKLTGVQGSDSMGMYMSTVYSQSKPPRSTEKATWGTCDGFCCIAVRPGKIISSMSDFQGCVPDHRMDAQLSIEIINRYS